MKKRIKLCLIAPYPPPYGGIANWTRIVYNYLKKEKIEVELIDTAPKKRVTEGRGIVSRVVFGGLSLLGIISRLIRVRKDIDAVHLTTSGSLAIVRDLAILFIFKLKKIPVTYHLHFGRIAKISKSDNLEWKLLKLAVSMSKNVISMDLKTYEILSSLYKGRIRYIENPIDLSEMPPIEKDTEDRMVFLGWIVEAKGISELLASFNEIFKLSNNWKLELIGPYKKEYIDELKKKYSFSGVELRGELSHDLAMFELNRAKIFVLPSYTEGCPYSVIEAMSLGKTVVATKVGNIENMLGDAGILVKSKDVVSLSKGLMRAIEQSDKFNEKSYKRVLENFDIKIVVEKLKECWEKE